MRLLAHVMRSREPPRRHIAQGGAREWCERVCSVGPAAHKLPGVELRTAARCPVAGMWATLLYGHVDAKQPPRKSRGVYSRSCPRLVVYPRRASFTTSRTLARGWCIANTQLSTHAPFFEGAEKVTLALPLRTVPYSCNVGKNMRRLANYFTPPPLLRPPPGSH